jgi:hypothetical protein
LGQTLCRMPKRKLGKSRSTYKQPNLDIKVTRISEEGRFTLMKEIMYTSG